MKIDRRTFLQSSLGMAAGTLTGEWWPTPVSCGSMVSRSAGAAAKASPTLHLENVSASPIRIQSVEVLRARGRLYVASTSSEGAVGVVAANSRLVHCLSLLKHLVIPYFVGKDARDLESLVDGVYTEGSNYKYAGMPFWNCVAHVELSLFDMLGKMANQPVGALVGKVIRRAVPVYLSSLTRETTPEEEVDRMVASLSKTNARAVKLKIGGRMKNRPRDAERTNRLVPLARKTFGDDVVIYVDSNGSYTSAEAIEVGRMLQEHRVGFFEEPCPWQEYEETRRVADALTIPVAGGEQDTSLAQFEWMVRHRVVDLVQPDLYYNGGLIRCLRVARMAAKAGINITPHSPKSGPEAAAMLHFASVVPNLGPHQEYTPSNEIEDGRVKVPSGPGLGAGPDPEELRRAEIV